MNRNHLSLTETYGLSFTPSYDHMNSFYSGVWGKWSHLFSWEQASSG